jgi:hypothetical protein
VAAAVRLERAGAVDEIVDQRAATLRIVEEGAWRAGMTSSRALGIRANAR